jgi:putative ABC transport system permease protein
MNMLRNVLTVSAIGFSTLAQRRGTSFVIVAGVACVVGVLVSTLSVIVGQTHMYFAGGAEDRAIVLLKNMPMEGGSGLTLEMANTVLNAPGIAKGADGAPIAGAELVTGLTPPPGLEIQDFLTVRGIGPAGAKARDDFRIESGRMFRSGAQEVIVGAGASRRFGLKVGDKLLLPGGFWPIVGSFSNGGDRSESQFFADLETLRSAIKRPGYSSVLVRLANPQAFEAFHRWLTTNPAIAVDAYRVPDYFLRNNGAQMAFFTRATYVIGGIMALGALFGAMKIMYAAVRARTREIGTLRALGFSSTSVTISVLLEAILLSLLGAALGVLIAWLVFDGREVYSEGVFRLSVSAPLVALGLGWGVVIALLGGLIPAIRAGRMPAVTALRAV